MMIDIELAPRRMAEQKVSTDKDGWAVVAVSETPYDHKQFLFAEALGSFPRPGSQAVEGWRVYFAEKKSVTTVDNQVSAMLASRQWFAFHTKGPDIIGMYFPQSVNLHMILGAADAYFRSTGGIVDVPDEEFVNLTKKYNVPNPYSGEPEFCLDLIVGITGRAKINGMRVRGIIEET